MSVDKSTLNTVLPARFWDDGRSAWGATLSECTPTILNTTPKRLPRQTDPSAQTFLRTPFCSNHGSFDSYTNTAALNIPTGPLPRKAQQLLNWLAFMDPMLWTRRPACVVFATLHWFSGQRSKSTLLQRDFAILNAQLDASIKAAFLRWIGQMPVTATSYHA